jgi:hypothetical protein
MAYMNQEKKAVIANAMKPVLKKYGLKGSLSVQNHSGITLNIIQVITIMLEFLIMFIHKNIFIK